jgi:hypothetical protein
MNELPSTEYEERTPSGMNLDELIWFELKSKNIAIARYDSIIWKIRSGYLVILYGTLSLLLGTGDNTGLELDIANIMLIWGFSFFIFIVDCSFRYRQLKVVSALNKLMGKAIDRIGEESDDEIKDLLLIAGEKARTSSRFHNSQFNFVKKTLFPSLVIYFGTPVLGTLYVWLF